MIKCQDHAISVFLLQSTVFDNLSEYLTGDDILNLKKTNMVTRYMKKNVFCKQLSKQMDTWLYHHRKDVEYRNQEQEDGFLTRVANVRAIKTKLSIRDDVTITLIYQVIEIVLQDTTALGKFCFCRLITDDEATAGRGSGYILNSN
jgi:hypothetical protein